MNRVDTVDQEMSPALGDFTTTRGVIPIALLAVVIGSIAAFVALALLRLIGLFTHIFFFQRLDASFASPAANTLGVFSILVPVAGALIVGLMARYGSERIRGHGIPEALEAILIRGSRIEPRVAVLKPISAAISIGSGGPFGAEGPIIMTGGAFGSMIAQLFRLTSAERKTLLVAGAAAGMSATFAAPIASVLLAVELLLFELKPRSLVPVALASASAMLIRHYLLGEGPLFPVPPHAAFVGPVGLGGCVVVGVLAGGLSALMTLSVYAAEDLFKKLPIHWMWWPAIGGVVVGIGGFIYPRALGVGYDTIDALLHGALPLREIVILMLVKWTIWAVFLGSGTSGGVLAPLLMLGSALGGLAGLVLPDHGIGFWPLVAMGAILGGTMRSPLTGLIFAVELTGDRAMLLPILVATTVAHCFTVLTLRRSILTEKVARRGFHVSREYAIDPLEVLFVRDVMSTEVQTLAAEGTLADALALVAGKRDEKSQQLYPIVDGEARLVGDASHSELLEAANDANRRELLLGELFGRGAGTIASNETLRRAVYQMADAGVTRLLVVNPADPKRLVGKMALHDLLKARARHLEEERRRERVLPWEYIIPAWLRPTGRAAATGKLR